MLNAVVRSGQRHDTLTGGCKQLTWRFIIVTLGQKLCKNQYEMNIVYGQFGAPESRLNDTNEISLMQISCEGMDYIQLAQHFVLELNSFGKLNINILFCKYCSNTCVHEWNELLCHKLKIRLSDPVTGPVWPRGWVEVQLYSSMTAALEGGEWSAARPGRTLPPGVSRYPFYSRLGGPRAGLDGRKIPSPQGFNPGPSSPQSAAIPTNLPGPHIKDESLLIIEDATEYMQTEKDYSRSSSENFNVPRINRSNLLPK